MANKQLWKMDGNTINFLNRLEQFRGKVFSDGDSLHLSLILILILRSVSMKTVSAVRQQQFNKIEFSIDKLS